MSEKHFLDSSSPASELVAVKNWRQVLRRKPILDHTVAVPAALGLRGCELFAEFAVSYRHGGASRAGAATTRASVGLARSTSTAPVAAAASRLPLSLTDCRPPRPVGGAHFPSYFGRLWLMAQTASGARAVQALSAKALLFHDSQPPFPQPFLFNPLYLHFSAFYLKAPYKSQSRRRDARFSRSHTHNNSA